MTPPNWSDVAYACAAAGAQAAKTREKNASLDDLPAAAREDRELAIGKHLHDSVSAIEQALERIIADIDGDLPHGRSYHRDLVDRAARPRPGRRPAIIGAESRRDLGLLIGFRHAYGTFDYALAAPNVALAAVAVPRAVAEIEAFATAIGLRPAP